MRKLNQNILGAGKVWICAFDGLLWGRMHTEVCGWILMNQLLQLFFWNIYTPRIGDQEIWT